LNGGLLASTYEVEAIAGIFDDTGETGAARNGVASAAAFLVELLTNFSAFGGPGSIGQAEAGQHHARQTEAEFLQRLPPGDGLGHAFGQFIEFVVHSGPF